MTLTAEQIRRVKQAIDETETLKAREMVYSEQFQNKQLLAFYDEHLAKLNGMLPEVIQAPAVVKSPYRSDRDAAIAEIKAALKARAGVSYSVRRGTAWGWITVDVMPAVLKSNEQIVKAERSRLNELFGMKGSQPVMIPSSAAHRREYIERAKGLPVTKVAEAYWD